MRRKILAALALAYLLTGCCGKPGLVLYTWSDMFPPEILIGFEEETGIKIRYVEFDTNETMFAKLQAAKRGKYDLVIADDYMVENVVNGGLAKKIDHDLLSNFRNINPLYQGQFYDPFDEYTVPYGAGVQTIV
jgi:spermidine/putrescine transport system substrate-binding protein